MFCQLRVLNENNQGCLYHIPDPDNIGFCKSKELRCVEKIFILKPHLSHSQTKDWVTCQRLYWYKNVERRRLRSPLLSSAIKMGSLWDKIIGYRHGQATEEDIQSTIMKYEIHENDIARVRALNRAFQEFIQVDTVDMIYQAERVFQIYDSQFGDLNVKVVYDILRESDNCFEEYKLTSNPQNYLEPFYILSQNSTYFLAIPALTHCYMKITRTPAQKTKEGESPEDFEERIYQDIISRPSYYFIGLDRKNNSFGKVFYSSEFVWKDEIKKRYAIIHKEILDKLEIGKLAFYMEEKGCYAFNRECEYLKVCKTGGLGLDSNLLYEDEQIHKEVETAQED